jgi:FYVE zinc finger
VGGPSLDQTATSANGSTNGTSTETKTGFKDQSECVVPKCHASFETHQRFHCRVCRDSICARHSKHTMALPTFGYAATEPQTVCDPCYRRLESSFRNNNAATKIAASYKRFYVMNIVRRIKARPKFKNQPKCNFSKCHVTFPNAMKQPKQNCRACGDTVCNRHSSHSMVSVKLSRTLPLPLPRPIAGVSVRSSRYHSGSFSPEL